MDDLETRARPRDGKILEDESVEFFIKTGAESFHLAANASGSIYDARGLDRSWNPDWQVAKVMGSKGMSFEIGIPFKSLGGAPRKGDYWHINCCWNIYAGARLRQAYLLHEPGYHEPVVPLIVGPVSREIIEERFELGIILKRLNPLLEHIAASDRKSIDDILRVRNKLQSSKTPMFSPQDSAAMISSLESSSPSLPELEDIRERAIITFLVGETRR